MVRRQQTPGNGRFFDRKLGVSSKMNRRSIGCLEYLSLPENEGCSCDKFEREIKSHLSDYEDHKINDSNAKHFVQPLVFFGFVKVVKDRLYLSTTGKTFLTEYDKKNYDLCISIIIEQLRNTKYPNIATRHVKGVKTFPFRILFYYLLNNKYLTEEFLCYKFPHIINLDTFETNPDDVEASTYDNKFYIWVIASLCSLGILVKGVNGNIAINIDFIDAIKEFFVDDNKFDLFHSEEVAEYNSNRQNVARNPKVVDAVLKRDDYKDRITGEQRVIRDKLGNPLAETHHIIPMHERVYFLENYDVDIDTKENAICVTADTHSAVHHACDVDRKEYLIKAYTCLPEKFKKSIEMNFMKYAKLYKFDASI